MRLSRSVNASFRVVILLSSEYCNNSEELEMFPGSYVRKCKLYSCHTNLDCLMCDVSTEGYLPRVAHLLRQGLLDIRSSKRLRLYFGATSLAIVALPTAVLLLAECDGLLSLVPFVCCSILPVYDDRSNSYVSDSFSVVCLSCAECSRSVRICMSPRLLRMSRRLF